MYGGVRAETLKPKQWRMDYHYYIERAFALQEQSSVVTCLPYEHLCEWRSNDQ